MAVVNATIRIRAIEDKDLYEAVELLKEVGKRVLIVEQFSTREEVV